MTRIRVGDEVFGVERGANAEFVAVQEREVIAPKPTALEARKYCPVIDGRYALDEVVDATRYVETGQKTGNVVLQVIEASPGRQPESARSAERRCRREGRVPADG